MQRSQVFGILFFSLFFALGVQFSENSWSGLVFLKMDDSRSPAAIHRVYDFSHLKGEALKVASNKRILSDAKLLRDHSGIGIELGHFVTKDRDGGKKFACQIYDRIEMTFVAEGMAESGEPPRMDVEGPCDMAEDINRISPIWIPFPRLHQESPQDLEISFYDRQPITIRTEHLTQAWPKAWSLMRIRMISRDKPELNSSIEGRLVREILPKNFVLEWNSRETASEK